MRDDAFAMTPAPAAAPTVAAVAAPYPIRIGSAEEFARVRDFLKAADFNDLRVCDVLKLGDMSDLGGVLWDEAPLQELEPRLRWCMQTFGRGTPVDIAMSRAVCGEETLAAFLSLGLLRPSKGDANLLVSPVWLYPVDGFVIVSDRHDDPEGGKFVAADDIVFPAIYMGTLRFLKLLPDAHGGDALDLCGGTGVGAMHLARTARTAATADLTERCAFFAEFNARLNGVAMESLCGDLYGPAQGRQFDVVTVHPPFVPSVGTSMIYRDAGDTGEAITRRVIEGLPAHLRAGGTCMVVCVGRDTHEQRFEERVRDWLGEAAPNCDIAFAMERTMSVEHIVGQVRKRWHDKIEEQTRQLTERLHALGTRQFAYGALFVRRWHEPVPEPPVRVNLTQKTVAADFDRLFAWRRLHRRSGFLQWLTHARPRFTPEAELNVRHAQQDGRFVPSEVSFIVDRGFHSVLKLDAWVVPVVLQFDGETTVGDVLQSARDEASVPPDFTFEAFGELVRLMIEREILDVDFPR